MGLYYEVVKQKLPIRLYFFYFAEILQLKQDSALLSLFFPLSRKLCMFLKVLPASAERRHSVFIKSFHIFFADLFF